MMSPGHSHNVQPRPSTPLEAYFLGLKDGVPEQPNRTPGGTLFAEDRVGPWDDILCWFPDFQAAGQFEHEKENQLSTAPSKRIDIHNGVWDLIRDHNCGHENLQPPRIISPPMKGGGKFIVDVGLGTDGEETIIAIESGFVTFSFDMNPGSIQGTQALAQRKNLGDRLHIVQFKAGPDGQAAVVELPKPPNDGRGYGYVFAAALSDQMGSIAAAAPGTRSDVMDNLGNKQQKGTHNTLSLTSTRTLVTLTCPSDTFQPGRGDVPILTLDRALPTWARQIYWFKIDSQGNELKILKGAQDFLSRNAVKYVQYEFSPWLMQAGMFLTC